MVRDSGKATGTGRVMESVRPAIRLPRPLGVVLGRFRDAFRTGIRKIYGYDGADVRNRADYVGASARRLRAPAACRLGAGKPIEPARRRTNRSARYRLCK